MTLLDFQIQTLRCCMKVVELFENYVEIKARFLGDLFWLNGRAKQYMGEPGDEITDWDLWLKRIHACAEFMSDDAFTDILRRAERSYQQLFFVEWALRTRPVKERDILKALYLEGKTWSDLGAKLGVSSSTISRLKNQAMDSVEKLAKATGGFEKIVEFGD